MGLQVWLPLNGNLENQGIADITVTNSGATVNSSGKIGQCYSFDGSNSCIEFNAPSLYNVIKGGSQPFTIMFWIYHAAASRGIIFGDYGLTGTIQCNVELWSDHRVRFYWAGAPDKIFSTSVGATTWCHIALVYDGSQIIIYKNGVLQTGDSYSGTLTAKSKTTGVYHLGRDYRNDTNLNGKINDFRVYDYALSAKEVEEIAKGLVLHYKLDNNGLGNTNLLPISGSTIINSTETFEFQGWVQNFYTKTWMNENLTPGKQYTLSYTVTCLSIPESPYVYKENRPSPILVHQGGGWSQVTTTSDGIKSTNMAVGESRTYKCTFTFATATETYEYYGLCGYTALYRNENNQQQYAKFRIDGLKLEEGDTATRWSPAPQDLGLDTSIVYDCSGYKNNGQIIGTSTSTTDTPKYEVSSYMNATSTANHIESNQNIILPTDAITLSLWVKVANKNNNYVLATTGQIQIGLLYSLVYVNPVASTPGFTTTNFINNEWNHMVAVKTNDTYKLYINGKEEVQSGGTNYYIHNLNKLYLFNRSYNNNYAANANLSDIRIYATALTAAQIKELYETSMSIDNKGNIYTRELVEV